MYMDIGHVGVENLRFKDDLYIAWNNECIWHMNMSI